MYVLFLFGTISQGPHRDHECSTLPPLAELAHLVSVLLVDSHFFYFTYRTRRLLLRLRIMLGDLEGTTLILSSSITKEISEQYLRSTQAFTASRYSQDAVLKVLLWVTTHYSITASRRGAKTTTEITILPSIRSGAKANI